MGKRTVRSNPWHYEDLDGRRIGEAARMMFRSREEMRETFAEWEAQLVKTIHAACERAKASASSSTGESDAEDTSA